MTNHMTQNESKINIGFYVNWIIAEHSICRWMSQTFGLKRKYTRVYGRLSTIYKCSNDIEIGATSAQFNGIYRKIVVNDSVDVTIDLITMADDAFSLLCLVGVY